MANSSSDIRSYLPRLAIVGGIVAIIFIIALVAANMGNGSQQKATTPLVSATIKAEEANAA